MGADVRILGGSQDDTKDDEEDGDQEAQEDFHALLVKAWESKVFPVIRRRFRNEAERRSGLEQIKGALQLGELIAFLKPWNLKCYRGNSLLELYIKKS